MEIRKSAHSAWLGLALGLLAGTVGEARSAEAAQSAMPASATTKSGASGSGAKGSGAPVAAGQETAREASTRALKAMKGDSAVPLAAAAETAGARAARLQHAQALKAVRAGAQKMDLGYLKEARKREKDRKEAEKAGRTWTGTATDSTSQIALPNPKTSK